MSLSTYSGFSTALAQWLNREGFSSLTDQTDTLIELAQRRVHRDCDLHAMECVDDSMPLDSQDIPLPSDFLRLKSLHILKNNSSIELEPASTAEALSYGASGQPKCYAVVGDSVYLGPPPDQTYTGRMVYYRALPILSSTVTSNWFSLHVPELLLWGAMMEASLFLKDDTRAQVWEARYTQVKNSLEESEDRADKSPGALRVRSR